MKREFTGFEDLDGNKIYVGDTIESLATKTKIKVVKKYTNFYILNVRNELIPLRFLTRSLKHKNRLMYRRVEG
jgi:hypothetical protein